MNETSNAERVRIQSGPKLNHSTNGRTFSDYLSIPSQVDLPSRAQLGYSTYVLHVLVLPPAVLAQSDGRRVKSKPEERDAGIVLS